MTSSAKLLLFGQSALIEVYLIMKTNDIDWSTFNARAAVEAQKNQREYYQTLTWQERMIVANYLNSIKYNYPENEPPRMDKTVFSCRKQVNKIS